MIGCMGYGDLDKVEITNEVVEDDASVSVLGVYIAVTTIENNAGWILLIQLIQKNL